MRRMRLPYMRKARSLRPIGSRSSRWSRQGPWHRREGTRRSRPIPPVRGRPSPPRPRPRRAEAAGSSRTGWMPAETVPYPQPTARSRSTTRACSERFSACTRCAAFGHRGQAERDVDKSAELLRGVGVGVVEVLRLPRRPIGSLAPPPDDAPRAALLPVLGLHVSHGTDRKRPPRTTPCPLVANQSRKKTPPDRRFRRSGGVSKCGA